MQAFESQGMRIKYSKAVTALWVAATIALPAILIVGALRTYRALDEQREVYLRERMAAIASRLETAPALIEDEPGLLSYEVLRPPRDPEADPLAALWEGRELFRTEFAEAGGRRLFRAIVPFHEADGLRLARLEIDAAEADFLVSGARRHLVFVMLASFALVGLSLLAERNLRRQLELEHLARLGSMAATLAHEIRNPLGTIKGFAQLAAERSEPAQRALLDPIVRETLRLEGLVKDLLLYGRPSAPVRKEVSAGGLASQLAAHTPGPPVFEAAVEDVTFLSDPNLLEQALLNLIRNALEAVDTTAAPRVRLSVAASGQEIVWRVEDNGPGLSDEVQARLFEPFRTTKAFGTGLGLPITRKLVESLGGKLTIGNRPEGGVAAEIRLPRAV